MKCLESDGVNFREKRLGVASGEEEVRERCKTILDTIAPGRVKRTVRGNPYIEMPPRGATWWVYLGPLDDNSITVRIYPGNTVSQAREFFRRVTKHEFLILESKGWEIRPYLVFRYIGTEVCRAEGNKLSLEQYFDYWATEEIGQTRKAGRGVEDLSQRLRALRLINAKDQGNIKKGFIETKRDFINVCPGFELVFAWRRADANRLDRDEQFVEAVRNRANEALRTWGQTL